MLLRLLYGARQLATTPYQHTVPPASAKLLCYHPRKHCEDIVEGEICFSASSSLHSNAISSKRLHHSASLGSRPAFPVTAVRHISSFGRLSQRESGSLAKTYRDRNRHLEFNPPWPGSMPRDSKKGRTWGGRNSGSGSSTRSKHGSGSLPHLEGPVHSEEYIRSQHANLSEIKSRRLKNPKSTVNNYCSVNFGKLPSYVTERVVVDRKELYRATVMIDEDNDVSGIGDAPSKTSAEEHAALSVIFKLHALGLLDKSKSPKGDLTTANPDSGEMIDDIKLKDGTVITFGLARQFIDLYCKEFQYDPPETVVRGSTSDRPGSWDATMTVGGRRIGFASGSSEREARANCYIDVAHYLDECDNTLWPKFRRRIVTKDPKTAAGIHFAISEDLDNEIRGLCKDIQDSSLYVGSRALRSSKDSAKKDKQDASGVGVYRPPRSELLTPTEGYHETKSTTLCKAREAYETDPRMEQMRKARRSLPVYTRAKKLLAEIELHDVTICMAATGSGKTTQVPQLIFDQMIALGRGSRCNIVCTQPRRIAAISVAERVAKERGETLGQSIGYQVRFEARLPQNHGGITFCTTGIFLKRMQSALLEQSEGKPRGSGLSLDDVTHVIVDEVHERDVDTDLLLVVLKRLLADRKLRQKPLKIILMSATIDPSLFRAYFAETDGAPAPVVEIPGRTFPVSEYYMDDIIRQLTTINMQKTKWVWEDKSVIAYVEGEIGSNALVHIRNSKSSLSGQSDPELSKEPDIPFPLVALTIAHVIQKSSDGHVLVFLPGWDEMVAVQRILEDRSKSLLGINFADSSRFSIHLLHSTVPVADQQAVFEPPTLGVRRIILATNIAETSITIPDVVYVVDTGRIKEKRYDPTQHMSQLVSAWVGSSNLGQRAGRAGRHRPGEYYGIISDARRASLHPRQLVEMKRTDLTNVVMHVKAINFPGLEVEQVLAETIEPPEVERVASAVDSLKMVGALDEYKNLTSLGRVLLQLPVEVMIGRLVLYGSFFKCLDQALTLAALLTSRDLFMAPIMLKKEADATKERWSPGDFRSDALAGLNAYNSWWALQDRGECRAADQFCFENFLSKPTLLMVQRVKGHILQSLFHAGVLDVSAESMPATYRAARDMTVPPGLNQHGESRPLLAALIAIASQPNFAIRQSEKICCTSQDKLAYIHLASVNHRKHQAADIHKGLLELGEREIFAFAEKVQSGASLDRKGTVFLRGCTRLDPMIYMLFGAYDVGVTQQGLGCDNWLPITGDLDVLDGVRLLKRLMEACMLRVFDGICGNMANKGNDYRSDSRLRDKPVSGMDEEAGRQGTQLSKKEVRELDYLTGDIISILNRYSEDRLSKQDSRWSSRPATPSRYGIPPYLSVRESLNRSSTPNLGSRSNNWRAGPRSAYFDSQPSTRPASPSRR